MKRIKFYLLVCMLFLNLVAMGLFPENVTAENCKECVCLYSNSTTIDFHSSLCVMAAEGK